MFSFFTNHVTSSSLPTVCSHYTGSVTLSSVFCQFTYICCTMNIDLILERILELECLEPPGKHCLIQRVEGYCWFNSASTVQKHMHISNHCIKIQLYMYSCMKIQLYMYSYMKVQLYIIMARTINFAVLFQVGDIFSIFKSSASAILINW